MRTVTVHQAKTNLAKLLAEVAPGEEIVIARGRTPIAKLVQLAPSKRAKAGASLVNAVYTSPRTVG